MGIYDRDYLQGHDPRRSTGGAIPVVRILIIINVAVFVLDVVLQSITRAQPLAPQSWGYFSFHRAIGGLQVWRFVTYQFLHGGLMHLVFNMIGLHFFGPLMESYFGRRRFLAFYLLCGVAGAVVMSLLAVVPGAIPGGPFARLVGASGAIYGVLVGTAMIHPDLRVNLLFPPVELRLKTLVAIYMAIVLVSLLGQSRNAGGEACHLGGAILGFLLVRHPGWLDVIDRRVKFPRRLPREPGPARGVSRAEIDRVLDKISREGIHSLSASEKRVLDEARRQLL